MADNTEKQMIVDYWNRIKMLCKEKKITQMELCEKTGIDIGKLKSQITNEVAPKVFDAQKIADYLNVSVEFLVSGTEKDSYKEKYDSLKSAMQTTINEN